MKDRMMMSEKEMVSIDSIEFDLPAAGSRTVLEALTQLLRHGPQICVVC